MIFNFGGGKERVPDSFGHQAVPQRGGEEISPEEVLAVPVEKEIEDIRKQIKELENHPDQMNTARANALKDKLAHLENPVGQW